MARFDARKELVIAESNAIGTAHLRAGLLAEPQRSAAADMLRTYVYVQLAFYNAGIDPDPLEAPNATTGRLQAQLWQVAIAASAIDSRSISAGLFVQSLNEIIDLHAQRVKALENRIPEVVLYLVTLVAVVSLEFVGYGRGVARRRHFLSATVFSVIVVLVLTLILDLDRSRQGLITVSQSSMERRQQELRK